MKQKPVEDVWLSLEQVSQILGLSWLEVWRWARDGDPRLPAYEVWRERTDGQSTRSERGYRYKKQDVDAYQARTSAKSPTPPSSGAEEDLVAAPLP